MELLIEHPVVHDTYYVGDLDAGKALAARDRFAFTGVRPDGVHYVHLNDSEDPDDTAEWGNGSTEDEAWRFALGAMFGPIDSEYDEDRLRAALARVTS